MRKRGRGITNQRGETKAIILLYIADHQKAQTDEIREFLKKKEKGLNIKNKNLVYEHIKELELNGFITRIQQENNLPNAYVIKDGFENFKNLYLYLIDLELGYETDFMCTPYYQEYVESEDFTIKLIINTFKELIIRAYSDAAQEIDEEELKKEFEEGEKQLRENLKENAHEKEGEEFIDYLKKVTFGNRLAIKNDNPDNEHVKRKNLILKFLTENTIDDLYNFALDYIAKNGRMNKTIPPERALRILASYLIPEREKTILASILKSSPMGIEYLLDIQNHSPATLIGLMSTYFINAIIRNESKRQLIYSDKPLTQEDNDYLRDFSDIKNESPISLIAKSAFIMDFIDDNIIPNEFSQSLYNQLFLPEFKDDEKT